MNDLEREVKKEKFPPKRIIHGCLNYVLCGCDKGIKNNLPNEQNSYGCRDKVDCPNECKNYKPIEIKIY